MTTAPAPSGGAEEHQRLTDQIVPGTLYLVSTPIGHRGDLSPRAAAVIAGVDVAAAEDTRHTGRLLASLGLGRALTSFHEHSRARDLERLMEHLRQGRSVALVSDAGTPGLSDPGFVLVRAAVEQGVPITAVPGPSALLAALVISGLPTDAFTFIGFLPPKSGRRRRVLEGVAELAHTLVFYESPHRLGVSLADMAQVLGDRWAAVARELTKKFEEVRRDRLPDLARAYETSKPKGEFTVVVAGAGFKGSLAPAGADPDARG